MHANKREELDGILTGDIVAIVGLKHSVTGDTICDSRHPIQLEMMNFPEPVIDVAIEPKTKADEEKLQEVLIRLAEEDPTFQVRTDKETGQTLISGMGELHLEVLVNRMLREFKVGANVGKPQVAYKETITSNRRTEGKFIRQSGGKGQYGHVVLELEPAPGEGFLFESKAPASSVPKHFVSYVEGGVKESMASGPLGGYPVIDVRVILVGGSYHDVDSTELAFRIAASKAFVDGVKKSDPSLLEPIMSVKIVLPTEYVGDVINDMNMRKGKVEGMAHRVNDQVLTASAPLSRMFGYATSLRSLTQGRAIYTMEFSHYDKVPPEMLAERLGHVKGLAH